jgi:hypothetical protein
MPQGAPCAAIRRSGRRRRRTPPRRPRGTGRWRLTGAHMADPSRPLHALGQARPLSRGHARARRRAPARRLCRERVRRARHLRPLPGRGAGRPVRQARHHLRQRPLSPFGGKEVRYAEKRELKPGRGCPARRRSSATSSSTSRRMCRSTPRWSARPPTPASSSASPAVQLCYVEVEEPDMHKPLGDLDRLLRRFEPTGASPTSASTSIFPAGAADSAQGQVEGHRRDP